MVLLLIFLLYLLPVIIIHVVGYIIWRRDPDTDDQHTIKDLYEYYSYNYDDVVITGTWFPGVNILVLIIVISAYLFSFMSNIRIK